MSIFDLADKVVAFKVAKCRTIWKSDLAGLNRPYGQEEQREQVENLADANLVASLCPDGTHMPVLDLDFPHSYVPSSTPGHGHLYLDKPISWWRYKRLLRALWKADVIEEGYYRASLAKGATFLRLPGVYK